MGNAWVFPSISHSTGKCNKTHHMERTWEIGTHIFPVVLWLLFSYSIPNFDPISNCMNGFYFLFFHLLTQIWRYLLIYCSLLFCNLLPRSFKMPVFPSFIMFILIKWITIAPHYLIQLYSTVFSMEEKHKH